jgi:hypothetical protein
VISLFFVLLAGVTGGIIMQRMSLVFLWLLALPVLSFADQLVSSRVDPDGVRQDINGSIRYAVAQINSGVGHETIYFNPGNSITVLAPLIISQPYTTIDGGIPHTWIVGGTGMFTNDIFQIRADHCVIKNLAIVSGNTGVAIYASDCQVLSCAIGTDWVNSTGRGLLYGIGINPDPANFLYAANNRIGDSGLVDPYSTGTYTRMGNIICNNNAVFAGILANNAPGLIVQSNLIGVASDGTTALGNGDGIVLTNGCTGALIGGNSIPGNTVTATFGEGNIISANNKRGVYITGSYGTTVCGNVIGISSDQSAMRGNVNAGVMIVDSPGTWAGLPHAGKGNVICSNSFGVWVSGNSWNNIIQNNHIGVNGSGLNFGNTNANINIFNVPVLIGGRREAVYFESNVISGSGNYGVFINGSSNGNTISGNFIGTDPAGTLARPNNVGIYIQASNNNYIGGTNTGAGTYGNIISGNTTRGVYIVAGSRGNTLAGNWIGLDSTGNNHIANNSSGVELTAAGPNFIGVPDPNAINVISGNITNEIRIGTGSQAAVVNNYVGLRASGLAPAIAASYLLDLDGALGCQVGGSVAERNIFGGNASNGVNLQNSATGNTISGNWFGVLKDGTPDYLSISNNVRFLTSAHDNWVGTASPFLGNLMVGGNYGVYSDATGVRNAIFSNTICAWTNGGIFLNNGNAGQAKPVITNYAGGLLSGTANANDFIQIFLAEAKAGQGGSLQYLGNTTANGSGSWTFPLAGYDGKYITAQGTSAANNSSEFAVNYQLPIVATPTFTPTATPTLTATFTTTPTVTSTSTATNSATATPSRTASGTGTASPTATPTLTISATFTVSGTGTATSTQTPSVTISPTITSTAYISATPTLTLTFTSTPVSGWADIDLKGKFALAFPNPAKDHIRFFMHPAQGGALKILIYNLAGEQVGSVSSALIVGQDQTAVWDCSKTAAGIYLVNYMLEGKSAGKAKIAITR